MKFKQKVKLICECGKEVSGFSEHHVKENLRVHQLISKEHEERMKLIQETRESIIYVKGMNIEEIGNILEKHPIIIEDIKEIGRIRA